MLELNQEQKEKMVVTGKKFNLRFVILHGSFAKGISQKGSDLDIAVLGRKEISFEETLELHMAFSGIFGDSKERELDLKSLHGVDHLFRYYVTRDGVLLYGDRTDYMEFLAYAYRDFVDSQDLRDLEFKLLNKSIRNLTERYAG